MPFLVGYARVSTEDQSLDLQTDALLKAGVKPDNLHVEKVSGANAKRPELDFAIKDLRDGDTFVVWRLDRLARSMRQLYARLDAIYAKGAYFRSLQENFDFGTVSGKLVLGVLGLVAEFERQIIAQRTSAGIAALRARRKNKSWGPKVYMTPERIKLVGDYLNGRGGRDKLTGPEVAKKLKVSTASIYAFWKHDGHGKFVRKKKSARKRKEA
ncbi:recombinase family protein [Pseudomonas sp.]|uniref:recombinase family protein n=1 Tax=Pseudomonas sp. TaxID=306 RepID=UPI003C54D909